MQYHLPLQTSKNRPAQPTRFFTQAGLQRSREPGDAPFFQPKLSIGAPGDRYEQEADAMAERVVNRHARPAIQARCAECEREGPVLTKLQRQEMPEEEEMQMKPLIQRMGPEEEEEMQAKPMLQRMGPEEEEEMQAKPLMRQGNGQVQASPELESRLGATKGGGRSLPPGIQREMGQSFGADFSGVRVHTGSEAAQMSQSIQAQAFTHGGDIYFNQGKYNPESSDGKKLLAHELTHTVQQGAVR